MAVRGVRAPDGGEESLVCLLNRVLQISVEAYNSAAGGEVTHRQFAVLNALAGQEGVTQTQLVRLSGVDRSTLAELLVRLEHKGLVRRQAGPADARVKHVWLEAAGRTVLAEMAPQVRGVDARILALMSPAEQAGFVRLLHAIVAAHGDGEGEAFDMPAVTSPAETPRKIKRKKPYVLENLPMPALSPGAVSEDEGRRPPPKWKPPKPIWKVGR